MQTEDTERAGRSRRLPLGRWIFGGIVLAMVCLWVLVLKSLGHETLIAHATLVTKWQSKPTSSAKFLPQEASYVLDHHWTADGGLLRVPFSISIPSPRGQTVATMLERVDPQTGGTLAMVPLALRSVQRSTLNEPLLSPDGKWLLLEDSGDIALVNSETGAVRPLARRGYGKDCPVILATMRQSQIMTMETSQPNVRGKMRMIHPSFLSLADRVAWARDSQSFFEMKQSKTTPYYLQQRTLADKIVLEFPMKGFAGMPQVLGQTQTGEVLLVDRTSNYVSTLFFFDLKTGQIRTVAIKEMPQGLLIKQMELSPDGNRLLWKTVNVNPPPIEALALMASQMAQHPLQFKVSIQVSDLEGAQMHEIAAERMSSSEEDAFQIAHWLPGSKRVSFWYKGSLYTLAAP